jgi:hypothetical protein
MIDTNEVYGKIKEMSKWALNPRPAIAVKSIMEEMQLGKTQITPLLIELSDLRLILLLGQPFTSVKLTLLGNAVIR